jgi:methyl-accepting chemotaxis protein
MFQPIGKFSVIARLRGLTLLSVVAMLGVALSLIWSGYQQRLVDRQTAVRQAVEVAHARIQLAYAQQQFGKLDMVRAQKQALAALDKLSADAKDYLWINDEHRHTIRPASKLVMGAAADATSYVKGFEPWGWIIGTGMYIEDLQSALMTQAALTLGAVLLVAMFLWGFLELTARELKAQSSPPSIRPAKPALGPQAYMQGTAKKHHTEQHPAASESLAARDDAEEASAQEVKRLRMAGAI